MRASVSNVNESWPPLVGAAVVLVLNLFVIKFFVTNQRGLRDEFAAKTTQLKSMQSLFRVTAQLVDDDGQMLLHALHDVSV